MIWGTVITVGMVSVGGLIWRLLQAQGAATPPTDEHDEQAQ